MSFTKPGPLVGYVTGDLIDEADINYWCSKLPDCIDGAGGGSYSLSAPLSITGDTVTFDDIEADSLTVSGDIEAGDDLRVLDNADIAGGLVVHETLDVTGDATFDGLATFNDSISVDLNVTCDSLAAGDGQFLGTLEFLFKTSIAPDANTAYSGSSAGRVVFIETMTTNRAYTFSGVFDAGQWFLFKHRAGGGYTATVNTVPLTVAQAALFIYNGSAWRVMLLDETL